jgi:hypothetical protein
MAPSVGLRATTAAAPLARAARLLAGADPDAACLRAAVLEAARRQHVVVTEHAVAIQRAFLAANSAEADFRAMQREGRLRVFNARYAEYRQQMLTNGGTAIAYTAALQRLKKVLFPQLAAGKTLAQVRIDFAVIFSDTKIESEKHIAEH